MMIPTIGHDDGEERLGKLMEHAIQIFCPNCCPTIAATIGYTSHHDHHDDGRHTGDHNHVIVYDDNSHHIIV